MSDNQTMEIRNARILEGIDISKGKGLEIGPLTSPILRKNEANIFYLDHMSTADLKKKYKNEPVTLEQIVDVDYVLKDNDLVKTVGRGKFDYVIASHVIEHIPDMLGWLKQVETILKPNGVVSLIIPDKRFTFDIGRRVSLPADVIGAHLDRLTRFSSAMMYDFATECKVEVETAEAWRDPETCFASPKRWDSQVVYKKCLDNLDPKLYVDCHCFVFTPLSFIEILRVAMQHKLLNFEVVNFLETQENEIEFYVTLRKIDTKKVSVKSQLKSLPVLPDEADKVKELEQQIEQLTHELELMTNSISWKATRGLRRAKQISKKLRGGK